ncbi:MAG: hypothetical protein WCD18_10845 [Thermosynechococcaceae cyanobacterium]
MIEKIATEDLFCKIYVSSELNRFQLAEFIGFQLDGITNGKFVSTHTLEIEFRENEDFDPEKSRNLNFLFYPIYLEIEPKQDVESLDYINEVGKLVNILRNHEYQAIASCDFEDELPIEVITA